MAKAPAAAKEAVQKKVGGRGDVKALVESIGKDAWAIEEKGDDKKAAYVKMFLDSSAQQGWDFTGVEKSLFQYINNARSELGWTAERKKSGGPGGSGGNPTSSGEPTISDLKNARKLAESLNMDTAKLLELVAKLTAFGPLDKLEASLEALEELMGE